MNIDQVKSQGQVVYDEWMLVWKKAVAAGLSASDLQPMCDALTALHAMACTHFGQTVVPDAGTPKPQ